MSDNIFSSFYNRVLSFFQADKSESESAKDKATNRLKLVLMQDRSNLDGATMQKMREQLISVISKYIEIDQEALNLNLEAEGDEIALMLNIPVIRARTPEEIEELEQAEEEAKRAEIRAAIEAEKSIDSEGSDVESEDENQDVNDSLSDEEKEEEQSVESDEQAESGLEDCEEDEVSEESDEDDDGDDFSCNDKKSKK